MKKIKKSISILLVILLIFSCAPMALAQEVATEFKSVSAEKVSISMTSLKTNYSADEKIEINAKAKNNMSEAIPVKLNFKAAPLVSLDKTSAVFDVVEVGETVEVNLIAESRFLTVGPDKLQTAYSMIFGTVFSFIYELLAIFNSHYTALRLTVDDNMVTVLASAETVVENEEPEDTDDEESFTVSFDLNYENAEDTIPSQNITAGFSAQEPASPERDGYVFTGWYKDEACTEVFSFNYTISEDTVLYAGWTEDNGNFVTRDVWVAALVDTIENEISYADEYSFDDYEQSANADKIETAIMNGYMRLTPDADNMVCFYPGAMATREFIAYTIVNALKYIADENAPDSWADASAITYSAEANKVVNLGLLNLTENKFMPVSGITVVEMNEILDKICDLLAEEEINTENVNTITYAENVTQVETFFSVDEEENKAFLIDGEAVKDWQPGEVHILNNAEDETKSIAVKVVRIYEENGYTVVEYTKPEINEVVESFNIEGIEDEKGYIIPAEGVTIKDAETPSLRMLSSRASVGDTISLWGEKNYTVTVDNVEVEMTIDFESLEYRFVASPAWHLISIDDVFLKLNYEASVSVTYSDDAETGIEDNEIPLADIKIPVGWGFNGSIGVFAKINASGEVSISFDLDGYSGINYEKHKGIRVLENTNQNVTPVKIGATIGVGFALEPSAEFLGIPLVSVGAEGGINADFELAIKDSNGFCADVTAYIYLKIYAQIGWDDLNLTVDYDIFNSDNSIYRENLHVEETGIVDQCTRGNGSYKGTVINADTKNPISGAKVEVYRARLLIDITYTNDEGKFEGSSLPSGSYKVVISARGFNPYEQQFDIVRGQTTTIPTQLMLENTGGSGGDDVPETYTCSGTVKDAYTGVYIPGVTIEIRSMRLNETSVLIKTVTTDAYGNYSFSIERGKYELKASKESYVSNVIYVTVNSDVTNANIVLNPSDAIAFTGELRAVLTWGEYPYDLDSHMVGPDNGGRFHVYYSHMYDNNVSLDVDDTTSYGPETITITETESGVYSYYIHDYSNAGMTNSTRMSNSGAKIQLYSGHTLMYTIAIPENQVGTLWHVFDFDADTGMITLVNEFSNESNASDVGR